MALLSCESIQVAENKNSSELIRKLKEIILSFVPALPDEVANKVEDIWFVFDENTIMFKGKMLVFASHESALKTITFYLSSIKSQDFTDKRLKDLVIHEYGHAVGMDEEQISRMMVERK